MSKLEEIDKMMGAYSSVAKSYIMLSDLAKELEPEQRAALDTAVEPLLDSLIAIMEVLIKYTESK